MENSIVRKFPKEIFRFYFFNYYSGKKTGYRKPQIHTDTRTQIDTDLFE